MNDKDQGDGLKGEKREEEIAYWVDQGVRNAEDFEKEGRIDSLDNLKG